MTTTRRDRAAVVAMLALLASRAASAFQTTSAFVPADQVAQDHVPGGTLLLAAYAVAWVVVVAYVWIIWRRAGRIERELADLAAKIDARGRRLD
ncbi:MAG TPA: CcmD family protein [Vicinamibacterales bacterium]